VTALEPVHVLVLTIFDFRALLLEAPEISIKLLSVLSHSCDGRSRPPFSAATSGPLKTILHVRCQQLQQAFGIERRLPVAEIAQRLP
jgi:hypothetical protein